MVGNRDNQQLLRMIIVVNNGYFVEEPWLVRGYDKYGWKLISLKYLHIFQSWLVYWVIEELGIAEGNLISQLEFGYFD